jgi:hypothetical protein
MSADHDTLIRRAKQLMAMSIALRHTTETRRRDMEKRLHEGEARIVRTRQLLAVSSALLQPSQLPRPRA